MFVSFIIILAIILAYAEDKKVIKNGITMSFWLIVIVFSLRYGYGNDFKTYEELFYSIISYPSLGTAIHENASIEPGWVALNYLCKPLGFQFVLVITTLCVCYIYYYLIKKYVPKPYTWVGILIFLMYPNLFVLNLSMLRQGLAGALFFLSFIKGYENKWIHSIILIFLAVSVHQIAIICIPFVLMINIKRILNPAFLVLVIIASFVFCIIAPFIIEELFGNIMSIDYADESYSNYLSRGGAKDIRLALFTRLIVVIPSIICFRKLKELDKYLTIMFIISPFTILLSTQLVLLLRLECFFLPFSTLLFSRLLSTEIIFDRRPINWSLIKPAMIIVSLGWTFFSARSFFHFFSEPTYAKHYATFHTVFSILFPQ